MIHNLEAEQAVLGQCMAIEDAHAVRTAAEIITADDWYRPAHADLWRLLTELTDEQTPTDPVIVLEEATRRGVKIDGPYLHTLYAAAAGPALTFHAQIVADCATRRRVAAAGQRMAQRAEQGDADPAELVAWAAEQLAAARDDRQGVDLLASDWDTFLRTVPEQRTMIVPDLLGEGDRLVMTGEGGAGKSHMLHQIAVCAAAGIPPFDWHVDDTYEPQRVTILDFENPDHRVKSRLWPMVKDCLDLGADPRPNLHIGGGGNPLDVLNPQNALSLLRTIEHDKPALVYIGPAYKMHNDDPDKEIVVKKITGVLDSIRAMGCSILTEAHHSKAGKNGGTLEPSGSNLWTWWPEFGYGMRIVSEPHEAMRRARLVRWRFDRVAASWPQEVEQTGKFGLGWARADGVGWRAA